MSQTLLAYSIQQPETCALQYARTSCEFNIKSIRSSYLLHSPNQLMQYERTHVIMVNCLQRISFLPDIIPPFSPKWRKLCPAEIMSGGNYVRRKLCPAEIMSGGNYVRRKLCPAEIMSGGNSVRGDYVRGRLSPGEIKTFNL